MIKNTILSLIAVFALGACAHSHSHKGHDHSGKACCAKEETKKCTTGTCATEEKRNCADCKKSDSAGGVNEKGDAKSTEVSKEASATKDTKEEKKPAK